MTYRIVVGVDGSPHSDAALRWSIDEAEVRNGEVTAVFAWQVPFLSFPGAFDLNELEQASKEFIVDNVSRVEKTPPVPLLTLVAEGDPAASLIKAAKGANLLVVGTLWPVTLVRAFVGLGEPAMCRRGTVPGGTGQVTEREAKGAWRHRARHRGGLKPSRPHLPGFSITWRWLLRPT